MSPSNTIFFSILGGVLPALLWLWFWLKEDRLHPEPRLRITISFISGMLAVWPAIWLERYLCVYIEPRVCTEGIMPGLLLIVLWAATEEILKFVATSLSSFWKNKYNDEPIDAVIYLITVALGFSALENTLFIFNPIDSGNFIQSIMAGNSRFLGATLLHVASSAAIGVMIGLSYYKKSKIKKIFLYTGIVLSILLHTIFNLLIIKSGNDLFFVFAGVWVLIILLIVLIEKVKKINS
ncbi:MAG: PrsW family glutamic-type intramembrane protease [Candidatus Zambryskibacteria bacterium]